MRDIILERTNKGYDIFRRYIKFEWKPNKGFLNPLYDDTKPSCYIFLSKKRGVYTMFDHGSREHSGDCFFLVGMLHGLDSNNSSEFIEIMLIIDRDLNLNCNEKNYKPQKSRKKIKVIPMQKSKEITTHKEYKIKERPFIQRDMQFWEQYGINRATLNRFNVVALGGFESVSANGKPYQIIATINEPMYGYKQNELIKLYRPFTSQYRFIYGGKASENYCFGLEQLPPKGDILFITGGEKDVLSLSAHGFNAICFNSETSNIPEGIIKTLAFMFKHIVILYDMDSTGIKSSISACQELSAYGIKRMMLPLPGSSDAKDVSDFFRLGNSADDLRMIFINLLDSLYSNTMSILKSCEINLETPPKTSEVTVSINDVRLGTEGNILCVTGGEGTGKSNFVGAIIAGAINSSMHDIDTLGVTVAPNINNKAVLFYDTEQSEEQLHKNSSNILRRAQIGSKPDSFKAYNLTAMERKVRLHTIIESMDRFFHYYKGIHLVVIDGIADLVRGANDESESISVVEELYRLAGIYKTTIICVLHYTPSSGKLRGHLGSELQRKAAAILSIDRDKNPRVSVIKSIKVRDGSPYDVPLLQFSWNKELQMHTFIGEKPKEEKEQRKYDGLLKTSMRIFDSVSRLSYEDIIKSLVQDLSIKESTAESYLEYMITNELVVLECQNSMFYKLPSKKGGDNEHK